MTVEVHDRDRKTEDVKLKASLFGDDLEDEKISNVGTVASECSLRKGAVFGGGGWILLLLGVSFWGGGPSAVVSWGGNIWSWWYQALGVGRAWFFWCGDLELGSLPVVVVLPFGELGECGSFGVVTWNWGVFLVVVVLRFGELGEYGPFGVVSWNGDSSWWWWY